MLCSCHLLCKQYRSLLTLSCFVESSYHSKNGVHYFKAKRRISSFSKQQCSSEEYKDGKKNVPLRRNVDREGIPFSLLGDGLSNKIYLFNQLKSQHNEKSALLPLAVGRLKHVPLRSPSRESTRMQYSFEPSKSRPMNLQKTSHVTRGEMEENMIAAKEELWKVNSGTPDSSSPVSNIACGGCGALFHCRDPSLPGYMHSEKFKLCSKGRLKEELCQRCLYVQHFAVAFDVSVSPEVYPNIISEIKDKNALVMLIVDITDYPCSLWPGIIDIIGETKPVFVIGNKIDLLPCDHGGYLHRIVSSLKENLKSFGVDRNGNIKHVCVVSAKTGYGIEELITKIHNIWNKGDIYLVGCTNVGKSTLFNTLLSSDLCKVQAIDTIQHATISQWPGTTLNLLKFPILKMTGKRLYLRTQRLIKGREGRSEERKLRKVMYEETNDSEFATLTGHVGMTFRCNEDEKVVTKRKPFDPKKKEFAHGHFCYDTPGSIYEDQIINLLTAEELAIVLPKKIITPRTYRISKDKTLFVAGLARVDLIESAKSILVTVFSSDHLPVHMVYTEQAEKFYNHYLGTEMLAVPCVSSERLKDFPSLVPKYIEITGSGWKESCADVLLSSVGWISITLGISESCKLLVYTPEGRGCYVRKPPLLPFAVNLRGRKIHGTPKYETSKVCIKR